MAVDLTVYVDDGDGCSSVEMIAGTDLEPVGAVVLVCPRSTTVGSRPRPGPDPGRVRRRPTAVVAFGPER
jgi:hypothetical protein